MSSLQRYTSFNEMKNAAATRKLSTEESKKVHAAFLTFFRGLGKAKKSKIQQKLSRNEK